MQKQNSQLLTVQDFKEITLAYLILSKNHR